ncbi:hypothetical protein [Romboutsia sp.]|uniref:hypothetical protein n=1 Tax=Romboutsia sp. TaxID=1965302 RepID=UPI003F3CA61C
MESINFLGISNEYNLLSRAFCVDMIDDEILLNKNINQITKISVKSECIFHDDSKVNNKYYVTCHLSIKIRVDYICTQNILNYQIMDLDKLISIAIDKKLINKNINIDSEILDFGINEIQNNKIIFYVLTSNALII